MRTNQAQLPLLLFHDLGGTAVRNMSGSGIQEKIAMEISGHETRSVFNRYAIIRQGDLDDAAARIANCQLNHQKTIKIEQEIRGQGECSEPATIRPN